MNDTRRRAIEKVRVKLEELKGELEELTEEEQDALDSLPENLQDSERGSMSQESIDALETAAGSFEEILEELETAKNPWS